MDASPRNLIVHHGNETPMTRPDQRIDAVANWLWFAIAFSAAATSLVAQQPTASVVGRVTDEDGAPIPNVLVFKTGPTRSPGTGLADSAGWFELRDIEPGNAAIRAAFIGYKSRDTTIELVAGKTHRWNVVLVLNEWARKVKEVRANNAAAGGVDSFAVGNLTTDSAAAFTYAAFGSALLHAAATIGGADSNRILSPYGGGQALSRQVSSFEPRRGHAVSEAARVLLEVANLLDLPCTIEIDVVAVATAEPKILLTEQAVSGARRQEPTGR